MKKFHSLTCCLMIVLFAGCNGIMQHDYIGMTKAEVAKHLEKHAFRSRWNKNRFVIEISEKNIMTPFQFNNATEVVNFLPVSSAGKWRCNFYPQRHWLMGWHSLAAKWHYQELFFQNGKVVKQTKGVLPYKVLGIAGKSPFPQIPKNFHKVSENIYRSNQPDDDEFESLFSFNNIRSVLNLRENNSDKKTIDRINSQHRTPTITLYEIPLDTGKISEADLNKILTVIRDAPKPLLIHCWHGSDRTGCAVAAYRIVFENWSVEDAIAELMKPEYGHHKNIYTNIPELLRKADWNKIKPHYN